MNDKFKYPSLEAVKSILRKLGVKPESRVDANDQDYEYTSCELKELEQYISLYKNKATTNEEKRVLGCFLLECFNEYIGSNSKVHEQQENTIAMLRRDSFIHKSELEYWSNTEDTNKDNWWYITEYLVNGNKKAK